MYQISDRMNFRKNDVRSVSLVLLAFSMVGGMAFSNDALAQNLGMSINVNANEGASALLASGQTTALSNDVTISVMAPNGNIVLIDQVSPDTDGSYMTEIQIGSLWKQDGWYTVSAQQGDANLYQVSVQVQILGGSTMATSVSESSLDFGPSQIITPTNDIGGLTMTVDAPEGAITIGIDGKTDHLHTDVTIVVEAPNGNRIHVGQVTPVNGEFSTEVDVGCPSWKQDGFYTITAQQGESNFYKTSAEVEIKECVVVPEFGTIAVLVLAVAIISIIAVTARSRLSVMPRF